jgi:predicted MPP superfamily phosphohydrolase
MESRLNKKTIYTNKGIGESTIVTLSDIHFKNDKYVSRLTDLKKQLLEIKPNVICMPGDFIDTFDDIASNESRQNALDISDQLSKISLTVLSFSAHDYYSKNVDKKVQIQKWFNELKTN